MIRLLVIAALVAVAVRYAFGRWPWDYLRTSRAEEGALGRAMRLLGVNASADATAIRAAHRRKIAALHPDKGGNLARAQELNAARDLLLATLDPPAELP